MEGDSGRCRQGPAARRGAPRAATAWLASLLAACVATVFAFDANQGAYVEIVAPGGPVCAQGDDGASLVRCLRHLEIDGVDVEISALAKSLGEALEVRTDMDDDAGGPLAAHARFYQTFVVTSEVLAEGDPVELLLVANLAGVFREDFPAGPASSEVELEVRLWTQGCDATGCGPPMDAALLVDEQVVSGEDFAFFETLHAPVEDLAVGDVFGVLARLHGSSSPVPGSRVGVDANASLDFIDPDPLPDGPRASVVRLPED
jgi:hypothetical protein